MFGYIKPFKPELRIREFDTYKAVYCGLCDQLGRSFGGFARVTLSYDFVFLCMLHSSLSGGKPEFTRRRCCVNPLKRVRMCRGGEGNEAGAFGADIAAIMIYYKLLDNIQDSGFWGRAAWRLLYPFARGAWRKAALARPWADEIVARSMERQRELEARRCPNPDEACEPSAAAMAQLLAALSENEGQKRVLERMGYLLGRYVYLCDALDDLEKDRKSGNYNPFLLKYGAAEEGNTQDGSHSPARRHILEEAKSTLFLTVGEIAKACDLLRLGEFGAIIANIAHLGLRAGVEEILSKKGEAR